MVRKTRTDMPYAVCPKCNRSTTVGKLSGGSKIIYYCRECYLEFWVKARPRSVTCGITHNCGMRLSSSVSGIPSKYTWKNDKWQACK